MNDFLDGDKLNQTSSSAALVLDSSVVSIKANDINVIDSLRRIPIEITFKRLLDDHYFDVPPAATTCVYWSYDKT